MQGPELEHWLVRLTDSSLYAGHEVQQVLIDTHIAKIVNSDRRAQLL